MKIYRKISRINQPKDADKIKSELIDRFGSPIPAEAENLIELTLIKLLAQKHSFTSLIQVKNIIKVNYLNHPKAQRLKEHHPDIIRIIDQNTLYINIPTRIAKSPDKVIEMLNKILA